MQSTFDFGQLTKEQRTPSPREFGPEPHVVLMRCALEVGVPIRVAEIKSWDGPTEADFRDAQAFIRDSFRSSDLLMFRGGTPGQSAELMNGLIRAVAVLSFVSGGVDFLGVHWENYGE